MTDTPRLNDALLAEIVRRVSELPDRTSPDDWPDAMLVTGDELRQIVAAVLAEDEKADAGRLAAITQERDKLLADWREQDQALQQIDGLAGIDADVFCPADVVEHITAALQAERTARGEAAERCAALLHGLDQLAVTWAAEAVDYKRRSPLLMQYQWDAYENRVKDLRALLAAQRVPESTIEPTMFRTGPWLCPHCGEPTGGDVVTVHPGHPTTEDPHS